MISKSFFGIMHGVKEIIEMFKTVTRFDGPRKKAKEQHNNNLRGIIKKLQSKEVDINTNFVL